jgi:DNA-binding beta-propeller fold protein YncE
VGFLAGLLCALLWTLGCDPATVRAGGGFGHYGSGAGSFIEPNGLAVDQQSGDLYILDTNNRRVEKFAKDGRFLLAWGWGVRDGRTHVLQTCTTATGCHPSLAQNQYQDLADLNGDGELGFAEGITVDNDPRSSSHRDVYVIDISNHRVQKFSPNGKFLLMFGKEVNTTARMHGDRPHEDVCPVERGDRCTAGIPGSIEDRFEFPVEGNFIAVGPAGTVYVGDNNRVQEFSSRGIYRLALTLAPAAQGEGPETGGVSRLAVDASGNLYVVRIGVSGVRKYSPGGALQQTLAQAYGPQSSEGPTPGIALDPAGHVFLDYHEGDQHRLLEYDSAGSEIASFDAGMEDGLHGIAYDDATHELYLLSTNSNLTPPLAHVRIVTPPPPTSPVFQGFQIASWLTELSL